MASSQQRPGIFDATSTDIEMLLAAQCHIGSKNATVGMERYQWKVRADQVPIINVGKTWEKIVLAARIITACENPSDVCVISARPYGQRAVLKFAAHTGATAIAGRFTPGSFTNYITRSFKEPRLIVVTDPRTDAQAIKEASYVNIPVIGLCDTDSPLEHVDCAIPTNNKGRHAIGTIWWMLAREVLRLRGTIYNRETPWDVMVDLYFYRDPEAEAEEKVEEDKVPGADEVGASAVAAGAFAGAGDWEAAAPGFAGAQAGQWDGGADDWNNATAAPAGEWGDAPAATATTGTAADTAAKDSEW